MRPLITLTTDFGQQDEFVGAMKGVILSLCPAATLIDISHDIRPQDRKHAALILQASCPYFPPKTIHVAVVDPGVGTQRRIIALEKNDRVFLAPDNGILSPFMDDDCTIYHVTNKTFFLDPVSATFHGRDIFAPVAAHIANGTPLQDFGPLIDVHDLIKLHMPQVKITTDCLTGYIIDIDRFGNLITNITLKDIKAFSAGNLEDITTQIRQKQIHGISTSYGYARQGAAVALFGSRNLLEIAVNQGNAANLFNAHINDEVILTSHS